MGFDDFWCSCRLGKIDDLAVVVFYSLDQVGLNRKATVGNGGISLRNLQGGEFRRAQSCGKIARQIAAAEAVALHVG